MINFIYKYLTKLFLMISEFLSDDYISNPLLIEAKWFKKNKESLNQRYPYANAMKISKLVSKLGKVDGQTYLDKLR